MTFSRGYKNLMAKIQSDGIQKLAHNWMDDNYLEWNKTRTTCEEVSSKIEVIWTTRPRYLTLALR